MTIDELMQAKVVQKDYIQGMFSAEINRGKVFDFQGGTFRLCGSEVVSDYDLGVRYLKFTNQQTMPIKDADGRVCLATLAEVQYFADAYASFGVEQWIKKGQKFAQIDGATDIEQVKSVEW